MIVKSVLIYAIIVLFINSIDSKPTNKLNKRIRCFNPSKPESMPQDVYEKYKISSRQLSEEGKREHWKQFVDWWRNVFAKIGNFFKKVGQFFKNIFSGNKNTVKPTDPPATIPPPTPRMQSLIKNAVFCVEYDDNANNANSDQTTKSNEINVKVAINAMTATTTAKSVSESTTPARESADSNRESDQGQPSPNDQNFSKDKNPIIVEQKAKEDDVKEHNTDPTIVRAV